MPSAVRFSEFKPLLALQKENDVTMLGKEYILKVMQPHVHVMAGM